MTPLKRQKRASFLEPIPSEEAAQQAARQIRQAIIDGAYAPGQRLTERELTEQLNISRHPVRDALRLLAREGFVELHRNRGAQVSSIDASMVREVYAIRRTLGHLALDHIADESGRIPPGVLRDLEKIAERAARLAQARKHDEAIEADLEFQQAIIEGSNLKRVNGYFRELTDDIRRFDKSLGVVYTDQERYIERYIKSLLDALVKGDRDEARRVWDEKFDKAVERFLSALEGTELDGAKVVKKSSRDANLRQDEPEAP